VNEKIDGSLLSDSIPTVGIRNPQDDTKGAPQGAERSYERRTV
jgi:hypothetical protein